MPASGGVELTVHYRVEAHDVDAERHHYKHVASFRNRADARFFARWLEEADDDIDGARVREVGQVDRIVDPETSKPAPTEEG